MEGLPELTKHVADFEGGQVAFAEAVGCSEPHLSLILSGKRGVSWGLAKRIERVSGIPAPALMRETVEVRA